MRIVIRISKGTGRGPSARANLRFLERLGEGHRDRADVFTRLTALASKGSADRERAMLGHLYINSQGSSFVEVPLYKGIPI